MSDYNAQIVAEFREHGGRVSGRFAGIPLLLLYTTGSRTGMRRVSPLVYGETPDGWVVFGSNEGSAANPGWYHNLIANPEASIEVGTEQIAVIARELTGEDRSVVWEAQKRLHPGFTDYEKSTLRVIPVLLLTRR